MALSPDQEIEFADKDISSVLEVLHNLTLGGWVNFSPEVEPEVQVPERSALVGLFSARGNAVPLATWTAPEVEGRRTTLGITHGSGPRALQGLSEHGLELPEGWLKAADHPRRGLVITVPNGYDIASALDWLLRAGEILSSVELSGSWLARVYLP